MRNYVAAGAVLAASLSGVNADLCDLGSQLIGGNWYCQAVDAVTYQNFASSGSYNAVTNMDSSTGACSSSPQSYSGSLAPMNGELSFHVRGPAQLKQFAFYTPSGSSSKKRSTHNHHGHARFHNHQNEVRKIQEQAELEKRQMVTAVIDGATVAWEWGGAPAATGNANADYITAVIDGKTVSWPNPDAAGATAAPVAPAAPAGGAPAVPTEASAPYVGGSSGKAGKHKGQASSAPAPVSNSNAPVAAGDWVQSAYYDSSSGTAKGLTFLNNMGGQGSGVFDMTFGNSLSYASANGLSGTAQPQTLADTTLPSNTEVIIMTDQPCSGSSCGYYRPGTVPFHGFDGEDKLFLMEFAMPDDGTTGWNMNMPAIWLLNAQIPRTVQYGPADCSCWASGCGEFDLFEVLTSGDTRCKSTLHSNLSGGDSDYFVRPTGAPIKAAVLMSSSQAHIKILDSGFDFSQALSPDVVNEIASSTSTQTNNISIFDLL